MDDNIGDDNGEPSPTRVKHNDTNITDNNIKKYIPNIEQYYNSHMSTFKTNTKECDNLYRQFIMDNADILFIAYIQQVVPTGSLRHAIWRLDDGCDMTGNNERDLDYRYHYFINKNGVLSRRSELPCVSPIYVDNDSIINLYNNGNISDEMGWDAYCSIHNNDKIIKLLIQYGFYAFYKLITTEYNEGRSRYYSKHVFVSRHDDHLNPVDKDNIPLSVRQWQLDVIKFDEDAKIAEVKGEYDEIRELLND